MTRSRKVSANNEPYGITPEMGNYASALSRAFSYYNYDGDKKLARSYLKSYIKHKHQDTKTIDGVGDSDIILTYAWLARIIENGNKVKEDDVARLETYLLNLTYRSKPVVVVEVEDKPTRPTIQENIQNKISEILGDLEGHVDAMVVDAQDLNMYAYLQSNNVPKNYCSSIEQWARKRVQEFIEVYKTEDKELKDAYSIPRRQLANIIKNFNSVIEDLDKYAQFKKANRKPRVAKVKPAGVQVAKLKYKKEDTALGLKSINPSEIVGASQVWIYNTKYKRLAAYRTDSSQGIQVKGSTLQNYDPEMSEQRSVRRPEVVVKRVLDAGKIQLRKLLSDLATKEYDLTGRINDECIIVRAIK